MNKKLLSLFGLKWNPFSPDVPVEGLLVTPRIESFCWRVENLAREGGFALITGEPGLGKSVALRPLVERLSAMREAKVGILSRPQAGPRRLLPRAGGRLRGRAPTAQPVGRLEALARQVADPHRCRSFPAGADCGRGPGDAGHRPQRASVALLEPAGLAHAADRGPRRR